VSFFLKKVIGGQAIQRQWQQHHVICQGEPIYYLAIRKSDWLPTLIFLLLVINLQKKGWAWDDKLATLRVVDGKTRDKNVRQKQRTGINMEPSCKSDHDDTFVTPMSISLCSLRSLEQK
jgi:hypothetical protein